MTMIISGSDGLEFPDGSDQGTAFTGNAATITSGTIATARLASGTANSSTYLRGDQTWAAVPAATPGGSTTQVQYNNAGAFGGDSGFVYTGGNVGIGTASPAAKLSIAGSTASDYTTGIALSKSGGNTYAIAPDANDLFVRSVTAGIEVCRFTFGGNLQFNSGYGSVATAYGVRAWVNFNGTGTVAIRASGNVSSVSDGGTGNYTVNLSSAMPDSNFAVVVGGRRDTGGSQFDQNTGGYATSTSAASVRTADEGPSAVDFQFVSVAIIR